MDFSLWVDADSCPVPVRELVVKFILRLHIPCYFVANRTIPLPSFAKKTNLITMVVTENTEGAADDYIVEHVQDNDMVITRDIPLAARLVEKKITTINDRGKLFSPESIREDISIRNFNYELAQMGIQPEKTSNFNKKNLNDFANCLDRELQKKLRQ
ncbi:MAG: DUF188 domain-containing protein [Spirochaetaceae bacterium]|nr:DUF188 domain-containing protein [Spirochaetaceae bacterium]